MGTYQANAELAAQNHRDYFGRDDLEFRETDSAGWFLAIGAIAHKEETKQRKTQTGWQKVVAREVFVDNADSNGATFSLLGRATLVSSSVTKTLSLNSSFRVDGLIYTVDGLTKSGSNRICVHLVRAVPMEISRPGYRNR